MIKPLNDRIVIEVALQEETTASGFVLASAAKEKPQVGTAVAIGPGRTLENGQVIKPQVSVGDNVVFEKFAGVEVKVADKEYLVIRENDIIGIL
ncbi:MAG: co-chaperone GroES [Streptococcaceae bacterium]|nr:co-chaperone GroES [Streptococcaceae bacterium]